MNDLLKMRLQLFADPEGNPEPKGDDGGGNPAEPKEPNGEGEPKEPKQEETFTKEQMEDIIKQRVAREKKAAEKAVAEAEKLAKMNQEEKEKYEFEKLKQELEEYKKKDTYYSLSKEATKMLSEKGIKVGDKLLEKLVQEDADSTKDVVEEFAEMYREDLESGVKQALAGNSPKVHTQNTKGLTKEDFKKMTYKERTALYERDKDLYNKLK